MRMDGLGIEHARQRPEAESRAVKAGGSGGARVRRPMPHTAPAMHSAKSPDPHVGWPLFFALRRVTERDI